MRKQLKVGTIVQIKKDLKVDLVKRVKIKPEMITYAGKTTKIKKYYGRVRGNHIYRLEDCGFWSWETDTFNIIGSSIRRIEGV